MNRRGFLALPFVAAVARLLPPAVPAFPQHTVLWGDGVHDDTFALNEWGAGRGVFCRRTGKWLDDRIDGGRYLITGTITFSRPHMSLCNAFIDYQAPLAMGLT